VKALVRVTGLTSVVAPIPISVFEKFYGHLLTAEEMTQLKSGDRVSLGCDDGPVTAELADKTRCIECGEDLNEFTVETVRLDHPEHALECRECRPAHVTRYFARGAA